MNSNNEWTNPTEAWRAKIEGKLSCKYCTHMFPPGVLWCDLRDKDPNPNSNQWVDTYCHAFGRKIVDKSR